MLAGVPVLAASSGGPLETILDGETGWLRDAEKVEQWTEVLKRVLHGMNDTQLQRMGQLGKERVRSEFSETRMASRFDKEIEEMVKAPRKETYELQDVLLAIGSAGVALSFIFVILYRILRKINRYFG